MRYHGDCCKRQNNCRQCKVWRRLDNSIRTESCIKNRNVTLRYAPTRQEVFPRRLSFYDISRFVFAISIKSRLLRKMSEFTTKLTLALNANSTTKTEILPLSSWNLKLGTNKNISPSAMQCSTLDVESCRANHKTISSSTKHSNHLTNSYSPI